MKMFKDTEIILASTSPRRKELLSNLGITFETKKADTDEKFEGKNPKKLVCELSRRKALSVFNIEKEKDEFSENKHSLLVIGADTVVSLHDKILGKPSSKKEAFSMIEDIQGKAHKVYTGVTFFYYPYGIKEKALKYSNENEYENDTFSYSFAECTKVYVYPMKEKDINDYLEFDEYGDKAGAYGIQGAFGAYIKKIKGNYDNVVGLPLSRLVYELNKRIKD